MGNGSRDEDRCPYVLIRWRFQGCSGWQCRAELLGSRLVSTRLVTLGAMQKFTDGPSRLDAALTNAWKEVREVAWLVAVVAALSVLGIVMAVSLSFALDRHFGGSGHHTVKTAHCPTNTHR